MANSADLPLLMVAMLVPALAALAARRDLGGAFTAILPATLAIAALLFALFLALQIEWRSALTFSLLLIPCGLIAEIDRRILIIPDPLVAAIALIALVAPFAPTWEEKLAGAAAIGGLFLVVDRCFGAAGRVNALGFGDVKLAAAMGATVGVQHGLVAVAIAGVATLCGIGVSAMRQPGGSAAVLLRAPAPFGIGLAAALSAMAAYRIWSGL